MKLDEIRRIVENSPLRHTVGHLFEDLTATLYFETPVGFLEIQSDNHGVTSAQFVDSIPKDGRLIKSVDPLNMHFIFGTDIQKIIWKEVCNIPKGETRTYKEIAQNINDKRITPRTVGAAMSANRIAYIVPCHRVIKTNGQLGGYEWGITRKHKLLEWEKQAHEI